MFERIESLELVRFFRISHFSDGIKLFRPAKFKLQMFIENILKQISDVGIPQF